MGRTLLRQPLGQVGSQGSRTTRDQDGTLRIPSLLGLGCDLVHGRPDQATAPQGAIAHRKLVTKTG